MAQTGGDDLDDFVLDDYANSSAEEELEEIDELPPDTPFGDDGTLEAVADQDHSASGAEKKRKRKEKNKERKAKACYAIAVFSATPMLTTRTNFEASEACRGARGRRIRIAGCEAP